MKYLVFVLTSLLVSPLAWGSSITCANADRSITIQDNYTVDIYFNIYIARINIEGLNLTQPTSPKAEVEVVALGPSTELLQENASVSKERVFQQELRIQDQQSKSELVSDLFTCRVQN